MIITRIVCYTAASSVDVLARDELYNRNEDQSLLNNLIAEEPEKAMEMFEKIRLFVVEF